MIISPPFLPARTANATDAVWLDAAMRAPDSRLPDTGTHEGSFPLGHNLAWHNGMHIQAPTEGGVSLPARAIADGTVVFAHAPLTANTNPDDAQNYNPFARAGTQTPAWTDNGCVIIEHTTTIGVQGAAETTVVFYSVYMHLSALGRTTPAGQTARRLLQVGDPIWRKDEVGNPGQVYGHSGQIHFEVCLSEANLQHLMGRAPDWVAPVQAPAVLPAPTADGRTDSIFGSLYFYLPADTPTQTGTAIPASHLRATSGSTLGTSLWVKMTYGTGDCTFESFDACGTRLGGLPAEAEAEYDLYEQANQRHNALPAAQQATSSPSGWYELLRFGRNIGHGVGANDTDPLPATAAHWRRVPGPDGRGVWADLNAAGSFKFSDADFLPVMGWNCINDDTTPNDQRCDSEHLKELIRDPDPANTRRMETTELARRLSNVQVREKLRRTICKFPSEWNRDTAGARYGFAEELMAFADDPQAFPRLQAHLNALSFAALPANYLAADWRFHPREFVRQMRKCGWLSAPELTSCMPRHSPAGLVPVATARARIATWGVSINQMARKFLLDSRLRMTHLLAQIWTETGYLRLTREAGADDARYAPYIGRGLIQITWQDKYEDYNAFAKITSSGDANFNLELIATDRYHAGNSSGFYWVSKDFKEPRDARTSNLSRLADAGSDTNSIGKLCLWINGGGNHYDHRHIHFYFIYRLLNDAALTPAVDYPTVEHLTFRRMEFVREIRTVNLRQVRIIVGTQRATSQLSVTIDHSPQR